MIGIGKLLKQAREEQQLSLAEVERETKIRCRYLQALEEEDFDFLPGTVYVFGFLRNYAAFLGLDADYMVSQLKTQQKPDKELKATRPISNPPYRPKYRSFGRLFKALALFLAIVLAGVYVYTYFTGNLTVNRDAPLEQSPNEELIMDVLEENEEEIPVDLPLPEGQEVVLMVSDEAGSRCWVEANADGEISFSGILEKGETKTFKAEEKLRIKVGNAGVLSVIYNGKDLGSLDNKSLVMTLEFPPELSNE